jgi:crotonobetainyl-CoA:carnitine CoA-transferase CaiB-like acyl-CoA transferase
MFTPLSDLVVLDLSRYLPGPFLTRVLADLGATVIKVEPPAGDPVRWMPPFRDGVSAMFATLNAGKRSLVLDLRKPEAVAVALALVDRSDVVVESFRPGVLDRLGLGPAALLQRKPSLIIASLSGYGQTSSKRGDAGHDLNYVARAGLLAGQGPADGPPAQPALQVADLAGGAWPAAVGVLAALRERDRTGVGRHLDLSLTRGALAMASFQLAVADAGPPEPRGGGMLSGGLPCYRVYAAADGWLAVGALEPHFFAALCAAVGRPELAAYGLTPGPDGERVAAELGAVLRTRTRAEWQAALAGLDTCCEPVATLAEALADPDLAPAFGRADGHLVVRPDLGALADAPPPGPVPGFGSDADAVLRDLGVEASLVHAARSAGALVSP